MVEFFGHWSLFLLLNLVAGAIALIWILITSRARNSLREFIACWITYFIGIVILVETSMGIIGLLSTRNVLIVLIIVLACSVILGYLYGLRWPRISFLKAQFKVYSQQFKPLSLRIISITGIWVLINLVAVALAKPSTHVDTLAYHLPMPVYWAQSKAIQIFYMPWSDLSNSYFPGNGELLYLWVLQPFNNDLLVRLVSLFFFGMLGFSLYRLCRVIGASIKASLVSAYLLFFTPVIFSQATELTLDIAGAAFFILALGHLVQFYRSRGIGYWILFAVACGVFIGIKFSGIAYLGLLILGATIVFWWSKKSFPGHRWLLLGLIFLFVVSFFGGYWYIRNYVLSGNPLFPVQINLGQFLEFPGPYLREINYESKMLWYRFRELPATYLASAGARTYGIIYLLAVLVTIPVGIYTWFKIRRSVSRSVDIRWQQLNSVLLIALLSVGAVFLYFNTPYSVMIFSNASPIDEMTVAAGVRFSLIAAGLIIPLVSFTMTEHPRLRVVVTWALLLAIVQSLYTGYNQASNPLFGSQVFSARTLILTAVAALFFLVGFRILRNSKYWNNLYLPLARHKLTLLLAIVMSLVLTGLGLYSVQQYRESNRIAVYTQEFNDIAQGWGWISENTSGAKIALSGSPFFYPLYGSQLDNEVRYINISGGLDDEHHDFFTRGEWYREGADMDQWMENLVAWGAEYVVLQVLPGELKPAEEAAWIQKSPNMFQLVFTNSQIDIYKIIDDMETES